MKILSVLLLFMLAGKPWISCDASRKFLMVQMEAEGKGGLFLTSKRLLSEAADEENGMETELLLPDDNDDDKPEIMIDAEKKRLKQQKDPLMEALEDQTDNEKEPKKQQEGESTLSENGDGDLLLEESKEEKWVGEIPEKKKHIAEKDSSGLVTGEKVQKQEGGMDTKALVDEKPSNTEKVEEVKGFPGEASRADNAEMEMETNNEGNGSSFIEKEKKDEQTLVASKKHQASKEDEVTEQYDAKAGKRMKTDEVDGTVDAEKTENSYVSENDKSEVSDDEDLKTKKMEEERSVTRKKGGKGGVFEGSKSRVSDDKDLTGEAMAAEITEEETPADLIEREMQGGVEDLDTGASKERNIEGKRQQMKDVTHTTNLANVIESEGEEDQGLLNNIKTSKKPKSDVLQDDDSEIKGSNASNDKRLKTKAKKTKNSQLRLDVVGTDAGDSADLTKQVDMDNTAKGKTKKKKKDKSDKLKKENKASQKGEENSSDGSEQEEKSSEEVKEKPSEKVKGKASKKSKKEYKSSQKDKEKSSNRAEKEKQSNDEETMDGSEHSKLDDAKGGEDTLDARILGVVDNENGNAVKDKKKKGDAKENLSKGREEELPTIKKQEEKLEIEVQGIAKEAQEKAEGLNSVPKSELSSMQGADEEDDEYSDFMQDFSDLSTKFQDTALKVADHLSPNIQKLTDTSKTYFNKANQHITDSFSPIVGKQLAPFLASLVSYGLLLVPLAVVILLFEHIRALLSLQKVLLFVNIYLAAYFATLLLATFIMGEPMTFFYKSSASGYIHLQLLQALGYIIYITLQTIDLASSCSSEACSVKVTVVLQWFVAATIGFHYYVTVFHRAMALKGPHTNWKIYGIYSIAFLVLCLFARIKRVKKGYMQVGQEDTDKKH